MHRVNFDSIFLARQRNASLPTGTRDEHDPLPWVDVAPRDLLEAGALCRQGGEGNVLAGGTRRERSGPLWKKPLPKLDRTRKSSRGRSRADDHLTELPRFAL